MKTNRKQKSVQRKNQIIEAAAELFSQSGYHGVSVDEIARSAGVSKGNLYWHFRSKEEIFRQMFEHLTIPLFEPLLQILDKEMPPQEKLRALAWNCVETAEANPEVIRFGWQLAAQPELEEMFTSGYREWINPFIERVTPLFAQIGESRPEQVARFCVLALDALMGIAVMMPGMLDKESTISILEEKFFCTAGEDNG
ncbi:MAG: TetR/AcrR family transcriptional regulator [Dehalococcoidia bacterium]